jgi:hypothetical protein
MTRAVTAIVTVVIRSSSNVFAGEHEGVADAHAYETEREHRGPPDSQIHRSPLHPLREAGEREKTHVTLGAQPLPRPFVVSASRPERGAPGSMLTGAKG